jgi:hypothetical protein
MKICQVVASNDNCDLMPDIANYIRDRDIPFDLREFDSWKYSHDRHNITRLPAFHIYHGSIYLKTFYPNENYEKIIEECSVECEKRSARINIIMSILKSVIPKWVYKRRAYTRPALVEWV